MAFNLKNTFMSNKIIESELKKGAKEIKKGANADVVEQVKLLLGGDAAKDRAILKGMGMDFHIVQAEGAVGAKIELEKFENQFEGGVYHINDIRNLAINYRLRFLPSTSYKGAIDSGMLLKIKEFEKLLGDTINEAQLKYRFFILAPASAFNLNYVKVPAKPKDPVLFYKLDDNHFKMLYKWGNDFSILRAIIGWRWKNIQNFRWSSVFIAMAIASLIFFVLPTSFIIEWPLVKYLPFIGLAFGLYFVVFNFQNYSADTDRWHNDNLSESNWNKTEHYY